MQTETLYHFRSFIYILASVTFVWGLKRMGNAITARSGNLLAAGGMILAIVASIFLNVKREVINGTATYVESTPPVLVYVLIFLAIVIGTIIGWTVAKKVKMTKMPE